MSETLPSILSSLTAAQLAADLQALPAGAVASFSAPALASAIVTLAPVLPSLPSSFSPGLTAAQLAAMLTPSSGPPPPPWVGPTVTLFGTVLATMTVPAIAAWPAATLQQLPRPLLQAVLTGILQNASTASLEALGVPALSALLATLSAPLA